MLHLLRRSAWLVGGVAALSATVSGMAGSVDVALALLGIAVLATGLAAFLSFRALADVVRSATEPSRRAATASAALSKEFGTVTAQVDDIVQRRTKPVADGIAAGIRRMDHLPYVNAELQRRYTQLIGTTDEPMPTLGANWAATAPTILFIIDEVLGRNARRTIIECGSGASTLWTAAALRRRGGGGHVWSLESDPAYAEVTRENLMRHHLEPWTTVIDAPLVDTEVAELGTVQPWYDLSALPDAVVDADLLFVDGPPGRIARLARFPAVPQLLKYLRDDALIVLDDTNRRDERETTRRWAQLDSLGRTLRVVRIVGRSTMLEVGARSEAPT